MSDIGPQRITPASPARIAAEVAAAKRQLDQKRTTEEGGRMTFSQVTRDAMDRDGEGVKIRQARKVVRRVIWLRQDQVVSQMDHRNRHVSDRQVCRRPPEVSERR